MAQWMWVLIAMIGIALILTVVLITNQRRRTVSLQRRFGPEYDRVVSRAGDRPGAEAALAERAHRRSRLTIVPLSEPARLQYAEQWRTVQECFVDRPADTVDAAERLISQVLTDRGYPVAEDFDERADLVSVDHPHVVDDYRVAYGLHRRTPGRQATTEDLREAVLRYRSLFDDLLELGRGSPPGQDPPERPDLEPTDPHRTDVQEPQDAQATARNKPTADLRDADSQDAGRTAPVPGKEHHQ